MSEEKTIRAEVFRTLKLASPIMLAQFLVFSMTFVDNIMVGRLGKTELAGLALASAFYNLVAIIVIGILSALSPLISGKIGANDSKAAAAYARQGIGLAVLISAALLPLLLFSEPILLAVGQAADTSGVASQYLHAMMWAMPPNLIFLSTKIFAEASDDTMPTLVLSAGAALINIPLDYALIHGAWGAPALGVAGAGYATAALYWLSLISILIYFALRKRYRAFSFFSGSWKPDRVIWKEIIALGVPLGGAIASEMGFFVFATFLMGLIGVLELAAHQVAINASSMMFMFPLGLSFAVSIRVGTYMGRGDIAGARRAWIASLIITAAISTIGMIIFLTIPHLLVDLYDQKEDVRDLAVQLLMISGLFQLFDGFQVVGMGSLRGLKQGKFALIATLLSFWVVGFIVMLFFFYQGSPVGIWAGLLAGLAVACVVHHTRISQSLRLEPADTVTE